MPNDEWLDLAVMGVGAGAKGLVTGFIEQFIPGVGTEIGGIIAGGLLYYFGDRVHEMLQKFGAGVLISAIGGYVEGYIGGMGGGGGGGSSSPEEQKSSPVTLSDLAEAEAGKVVEAGIIIR